MRLIVDHKLNNPGLHIVASSYIYIQLMEIQSICWNLSFINMNLKRIHGVLLVRILEWILLMFDVSTK